MRTRNMVQFAFIQVTIARRHKIDDKAIEKMLKKFPDGPENPIYIAWVQIIKQQRHLNWDRPTLSGQPK